MVIADDRHKMPTAHQSHERLLSQKPNIKVPLLISIGYQSLIADKTEF